MYKALVIGLGMGQQYVSWLDELGYDVTTVDKDPSKGPDYTSLEFALEDTPQFDIVYIGTPNWTHLPIARVAAPHAKLVLVEKPGVATSEQWKQLVKDFPNTRIMMVKNNQYRKDIKRFKDLAGQANAVYIRWNNKNRIPNPGSWFTTKELSFGGVSRDLMPHMLSYYVALTDYTKGNKLYSNAVQRHELKDITDTDYGSVNYNGTHNVDDFCEFEFTSGNTKWILTANWKNDVEDDSSISFDLPSSAIKFQLGLCPKEAYQTMIEIAISNLNNDDYWTEQLAQDLWIHKQIENL